MCAIEKYRFQCFNIDAVIIDVCFNTTELSFKENGFDTGLNAFPCKVYNVCNVYKVVQTTNK